MLSFSLSTPGCVKPCGLSSDKGVPVSIWILLDEIDVVLAGASLERHVGSVVIPCVGTPARHVVPLGGPI